MAKITKDMLIRDVIMVDARLADVLSENGMQCVGCPMHQVETLEQACNGHGIDTNQLVNELNSVIDEKN